MSRISRRAFLRRAAFSSSMAVGYWSEIAAASSHSANEKLNLAAIGVGNRGASNVYAVKSENVVALCDVDERYLGRMRERFPKAASYHDFRRLLERRDLDAVLISTPNHTHFHAAVRAMRAGLHVYCEKPLAHSIAETRAMARLARQTGVVTQMGNQHHASAGYRRVAELVQSNTLGPVRQVHAWTSRPLWPQGIARPPAPAQVPKHLHWDLWLGPAPGRAYAEGYHPIQWRGWWDFGGGALGDMGPHLLDPIAWALKLTTPEKIAARSAPVSRQTAPEWSIVHMDFPPREGLPGLTLTWYDGGQQPPPQVTGAKQVPANGALVIGESARLFVPELGGSPILIANEKGERLDEPDPFLPPSPGHHAEWLQACKGQGGAGSDFQYGARLTEICLLGNVALRLGKPFQWDAPRMQAVDCPQADALVQRPYRKGWEEEKSEE